MIVRTARLVLRPISADGAEPLAALYADAEVTRDCTIYALDRPPDTVARHGDRGPGGR